MNTNRSNILNKQSFFLSAAALVLFFSSSCLEQNAQQSSEQRIQSSQTERRPNRIECKSPKEIESLKQTNRNESDLLLAVLRQDVKAVKKLLEQNADTEEKDNYQATALFYAVSPSVKEPNLTPPGEAPRRISPQEEQVYQLKARQEEELQIEITRELLAHGASPNQKDIYGETPLIRVAGFGYETSHAIKLLTLLLEQKAEVNTQDERGYSALMNATQGGKIETVKFLLAHGADAKLTNCNRETALSIAQSLKYQEAIRNDLINILQDAK